MKFKILTLVLLVFSINVFSQNLEISKDRLKYDDKVTECWTVIITPESKEVKKAFKRFIKDRYDVKMKGLGMFSNKEVLNAEEVIIPKISSKKINFYASVTELNDQSELKLFGNFHNSFFFNSNNHNDEYTAVRSILVDFLNNLLPNYYQEKIDSAQKEYNDFVETDEHLNKDITDNKNKIEKLTKENESLTKKVESNKKKVTSSKNNLDKTNKEFKDIKNKLMTIKR